MTTLHLKTSISRSLSRSGLFSILINTVASRAACCFFVSTTVLGLLAANNAVAQTCTPPPPNMVSWWPGDGDANDIKDGNNGTLQNGVTFATGMVDQAFLLDGIDDFVDVGNAPNLSGFPERIHRGCVG